MDFVELKHKVGNVAYRLALPKLMRCHNTFHVSLLRQFEGTEFPGQPYNPPLPINVDKSGKLYTICGIVISCLKAGRLEYLVEWLGFKGTDDTATCEPLANVKGCSKLVKAFHKEDPDKPSLPKTMPKRR